MLLVRMAHHSIHSDSGLEFVGTSVHDNHTHSVQNPRRPHIEIREDGDRLLKTAMQKLIIPPLDSDAATSSAPTLDP
jgi:hypothetical protein